MYEPFIDFVKLMYRDKEPIPLHEPCFLGNEKSYLNEAIDTTFVSSVGPFVDKFETMIASYTKAEYAIATVNGTAALHTALLVSGVKPGDEVITQPLTFVATCNAVSYCGATPVFVDIEPDTLGLSPSMLLEWLEQNTEQVGSRCRNKISGNIVSGCVPMHTYGHPNKIDQIVKICTHHNIAVVEDAAESLGSLYKNQHTGTFGALGVFSFNGNKTITTGGGGIVVTHSPEMAKKARHLTTTAKTDSPVHSHDQIGFNYRMPNINGALGCAQLEQLPRVLDSKRQIARHYHEFFKQYATHFFTEPEQCQSNYWLNCILLGDRRQRDDFLKFTHAHGVVTRPAWQLMHTLPMYKHCITGDLTNAVNLSERIVNLPSSAISELNL